MIPRRQPRPGSRPIRLAGDPRAPAPRGSVGRRRPAGSKLGVSAWHHHRHPRTKPPCSGYFRAQARQRPPSGCQSGGASTSVEASPHPEREVRENPTSGNIGAGDHRCAWRAGAAGSSRTALRRDPGEFGACLREGAPSGVPVVARLVRITTRAPCARAAGNEFGACRRRRSARRSVGFGPAWRRPSTQPTKRQAPDARRRPRARRNFPRRKTTANRVLARAADIRDPAGPREGRCLRYKGRCRPRASSRRRWRR